ncbi:hypothetical protein [Amycolatopsis vancoresmycina]|uniref:hypothetical protein n=1 Tax=Amycolatopsis vancoresmycina TaxID=208444 RepID=UPI00068D1028|nr:hypothetical protein [Amycolatopsis vancoresmycina]
MGFLFLLAVSAIPTRRRQLAFAGEDFRAMTVRRSALVSMPTPVRHHFEQASLPGPPFFDAVIIPSARGAENIRRAAETAANAGSYLVVLASERTTAVDVGHLLTHIGWSREKFAVLDRSRFAHADKLRLRTFASLYADGAGELSEKKNAGLLLARMLGWRSVLFVDDDVQSIGRKQLRDAAGLLDGLDRAGAGRRLVGWAFDEFPDFSSVGYARSYGTGEWRTFVSGGAMALRCDQDLLFFPPVYNEDMVLALEVLHGDPGATCVAGKLSQDEYDPFGDLRRVARQEFGEVLVEGLVRAPGLAGAREPEFWRPVLLDRTAMLRQVSARLNTLGVHDGERAVEAALEAHRGHWPEALAGFVSDWLQDLAVLREFQRKLPSTTRLGAAAAGLSSATP